MIISVDKGHTLSGAGSGAVGYLNESQETRNIGDHLIGILRSRGVDVRDVTVNFASSADRSVSLRQSAVPINADISISIHLNAGKGVGAEIWTKNGVKYDEAVEILDNLEELGFLKGDKVSRGIKDGTNYKRLAMCNTKAKKSMLVEVCFVDSLPDANTYKRVGPRKIAEAIADGLIKRGVLGMDRDQVVAIVREEVSRLILGESQIRALIQAEVARGLRPSQYDEAGNVSSHWASDAREKLIDRGIIVTDTRLNDPATRGEVVVLLSRALDSIDKK